jgi:hypothetical protein
MAFVRQASLEDVISVASRLRYADRQETLAATGLPPEVLLPEAFRSGRRMMTGGIDRPNGEGRPEVLFGCDPVIGHEHIGIVWLMGTDAIDKNPMTFLRISKRLWDGYLAEYEALTNFVMEGNAVHVVWLEWLGAKFTRRIDRFGPLSKPFLEFIACAPLKP